MGSRPHPSAAAMLAHIQIRDGGGEMGMADQPAPLPSFLSSFLPSTIARHELYGNELQERERGLGRRMRP